MIFDNLQHSATYESLHPLFKQAFDFLKSSDLAKLPAGKIELDGDRLYVSVQEINGKKVEEAKLESHKKYIDIQVLIQGEETHGWANTDDCSQITQAYNPDKDVQFFGEAARSFIKLMPNDFTIFYPGDAHAPCIGEGFIKKLIVKVLI